jgi:hypothetical protein
MLQKTKMLSNGDQKLCKTYVIQNKGLVDYPVGRVTKKRGPQNEGKSHDIIENKCRKNVSLGLCHDVDENKIVISILSRCC